MTVKDQDGKVLFSETKNYEVFDLHLPSNKEGWMGFDDWDLTAMTHINLGLEPLQTDSLTFVVPLKENTKSATIEATYKFTYEEGDSANWKTVSKKVEF
ncbi:MAG: hypothetical protein C4560_01510 [Nitrospiraceae bacterium]|nr:MAG: hypothetical protein C4560_01510 [Nitrospiraceae bacterium]